MKNQLTLCILVISMASASFAFDINTRVEGYDYSGPATLIMPNLQASGFSSKPYSAKRQQYIENQFSQHVNMIAGENGCLVLGEAQLNRSTDGRGTTQTNNSFNWNAGFGLGAERGKTHTAARISDEYSINISCKNPIKIEGTISRFSWRTSAMEYSFKAFNTETGFSKTYSFKGDNRK